MLVFYRKPLSRCGDVLECGHGKMLDTCTVARGGLACSSKSGGGNAVERSENYSTVCEPRAGSPHKFRIVGIDESNTGSTRFSLVHVEMPDDEAGDKTKQAGASERRCRPVPRTISASYDLP